MPEEEIIGGGSASKLTLGSDEIDVIINGTSGANKGRTGRWKRKKKNSFGISDEDAIKWRVKKQTEQKVFAPEAADYTLVDGYNVIFAWEELAELAKVNIEAARDALLDELGRYKSLTGGRVIAVFDAYKVPGHATEYTQYKDVHVVYTRQAQTADGYIEAFAHENGRKYKVTVVTSDGIEQVIIRGEGCMLVSSREFKELIRRLSENFNEKHYIKESTQK